MADFIYLMETRLLPDQQKALALVTEVVRAQQLNVYLTGGAVRDILSGFVIRDLDFSVQGNALKLQKDFEKAGAVLEATEESTRTIHLLLPGNVRAEVTSARSEKYEKPGKPPEITQGTIYDDMRRRDFTVNAMALSLNPGSRGLLTDPFNGMADIEAKVLRVLHNYAFYEEPSRLIRATRLAARFHWTLEERTQARYDAAKENKYIEHLADRPLGHEVEQLAHEEDPVTVLKALEKEGWLKVLVPHFSMAKVDTAGLAQLVKIKQQMQEIGLNPDASPVVMYFLTHKLGDKEVSGIQKQIYNKGFVQRWRNLEDDAKDFARQLNAKDLAIPSHAWNFLMKSRPETLLFTAITARPGAPEQRIKNFLTKWPLTRQKLPFPEMAEMRITPELPEFRKIMDDAFLMLLDGKLRNHTEIVKFLEPYKPPEPPPPPAPIRRGRAVKKEVQPAATAEGAAPKKRGRKPKSAAVITAAGPMAPAAAPIASPEAAAGETKDTKAKEAKAKGSGKTEPAKPIAKGDPTKPLAGAKAPTKAEAPKPEAAKAQAKAAGKPTAKAPAHKSATTQKPATAAKKPTKPAKPAAKGGAGKPVKKKPAPTKKPGKKK